MPVLFSQPKLRKLQQIRQMTAVPGTHNHRSRFRFIQNITDGGFSDAGIMPFSN
jgi:hypothetical protein